MTYHGNSNIRPMGENYINIIHTQTLQRLCSPFNNATPVGVRVLTDTREK